MKIAKRILSFLILFAPLLGISQTGPGGVGTNDGTSSLKIWYNTSKGVLTTGTLVDGITNSAGISALDISESGAQRPTLVSGTVNGFDAISFSGSNRLETGLNLTTSNFVTNQASSFVVNIADNTTQQSCVYTTSPLVGSSRFTNHIPWSGTVYFDIGVCCGSTARIQVSGLSGLTTSYSFWSYDADPSTGKQLYRNGALLQSRAGTSTVTNHASYRFNLGGNISGSAGFQGDITEVIVFNTKVNTAQRIIIENYLAAKYGLAGSSNDLFDEDNVANGNFDFDVAGIGRVDASNIHNDAQGTGIVRMLNPTGLGNDEFLMWGHDNGVELATETTDVPSGVDARFERVWRVSEIDASGSAINVGSIDIRWDLAGKGSITASDLRLLVDTDNDGTFADETPISGATLVSGSVYVFAGVSAIVNNYRFTLATINDSQTPLNVESPCTLSIGTESTIDGTFDEANSVYAVDLDEDGDIDVLGTAYRDDDITWWENDGSENFTEHTIKGNYDGANSVYAIDLDEDGDIDVLGTAYRNDDITWWENDGSENFTEHTIKGNYDGANSVYAIDLDEDGDIDVLGTAYRNDDITWWENDGSENFTEHTIKGNYDGANSVYAIDLDEDGDIDVLGTAYRNDDITWWENDGSENLTEHTIKGNYDGANSVYAIDLDEDGDIDVLGTAYRNDDITWWENDGSENFTENTIDGSYDGAEAVFAIDFDCDNDIDILGAANIADDITWWENDGSENFTKNTIDGDFIGARSVFAIDLDSDGDLDVLGSAETDDDITWWETDGCPCVTTCQIVTINRHIGFRVKNN